MATTENSYTKSNSNGPTFTFTFPYQSTSDIQVTVGEVLKTEGTHYQLDNATTIRFLTGHIPATGQIIKIRRVTTDDRPKSTFFSGSSIRAQELNDNFEQQLFINQEDKRDVSRAVVLANAAQTTADAALPKSGGTMTGAINFAADQPGLGTEVSNSPPTPRFPGDTWWDTVSGKLFVYYQDVDSAQWVVAMPETATLAHQQPLSGAQHIGFTATSDIDLNGNSLDGFSLTSSYGADGLVITSSGVSLFNAGTNGAIYFVSAVHVGSSARLIAYVLGHSSSPQIIFENTSGYNLGFSGTSVTLSSTGSALTSNWRVLRIA
jgi:hypothetical protein